LEIPYEGAPLDIFKIGVILLIIRIGKPIFTKARISDSIFRYIAGGRFDKFWMTIDKSLLSPEFESLMQLLLAYKPEDRATI